VRGSTLDGLDSLLSIVQMPAGVPVATMAINNATNAALFAARILALDDENIAVKLRERTAAAAASVEATVL
jgi:phosphoribosylaminoimidazole carboxylase PurE protein